MRGRSAVALMIGMIAALASVGWVWAQGRNGSRTLTGADYAEIQQLYARYAQGTDFMNAERWLDAFTEDAAFNPTANQPGSKPYVGREAMAKWRAEVFASRKPPYHYRHWTGSWLITPTPDGNATGRVYWMAFNPTVKPMAVTDTGYYEDVYVRTPAGWRIKSRFAHSDPQPVAPTAPAN
jgi:3-phenylpropionate/cinnamic acid dioxygenase small subunit